MVLTTKTAGALVAPVRTPKKDMDMAEEKKKKLVCLRGFAAKGKVYNKFEEFRPDKELTKGDIRQLITMRRVVDENDEELVVAVKVEKERADRAAKAKAAAEKAARLPGAK